MERCTDIVDQKTAMAELAHSRSGCYSFFAAVFARPPDSGFLSRLLSPETVAQLGSLGCRSTDDLSPDEESIEALAVEYTLLFVGPGPHLTPCESVWRDNEGLLWGECTSRVKLFIESSGLRFQPDWRGLPDHVSVELEFMARLCSHEAGLWGRPERVRDLRQCLETEESFLSDHLLAWVPSFCGRVAERNSGYYGQTAQLAKDFLESDIEHVRQSGIQQGWPGWQRPAWASSLRS